MIDDKIILNSRSNNLYRMNKTHLTMLYETGMYETLCFVVGTERRLAYYYPEAILSLVTKLKRIGCENTSWMWDMKHPKDPTWPLL